MTISIQPLQPTMGEEYVQYFDHLDFSHAPHWAGCYCQYYLAGCSGEEWSKRKPEQNRALALQNVKSGRLRGFLAYEDGQIVGWCNMLDLIDAPSYGGHPPIPEKRGEAGVAACFVIHPRFRGKGIASQLLQAVVEAFRDQGYQRVFGFPFEAPENPQRQYLGTPGMFERLGFKRVAEVSQTNVYELSLRE